MWRLISKVYSLFKLAYFRSEWLISISIVSVSAVRIEGRIEKRNEIKDSSI